MELIRHLLVLLHLIGFAALLGGCLVQFRSTAPEVNAAMLHGAFTQLVSGAALVVLLELTPPSGDVNPIKIAVKAAVTVIITILVVANRRYASIPRGLWVALLILALGNAGVAVLW